MFVGYNLQENTLLELPRKKFIKYMQEMSNKTHEETWGAMLVITTNQQNNMMENKFTIQI